MEKGARSADTSTLEVAEKVQAILEDSRIAPASVQFALEWGGQLYINGVRDKLKTAEEEVNRAMVAWYQAHALANGPANPVSGDQPHPQDHGHAE